MPTYRISSTEMEIGAYEGVTALDAYQAHLRDAGYRSAEHAASAGVPWDRIPDGITVEEAEAIDAAHQQNQE